jgi:hypothetical protein
VEVFDLASTRDLTVYSACGLLYNLDTDRMKNAAINNSILARLFVA